MTQLDLGALIAIAGILLWLIGMLLMFFAR
jgi:hypothetical protein